MLPKVKIFLLTRWMPRGQYRMAHVGLSIQDNIIMKSFYNIIRWYIIDSFMYNTTVIPWKISISGNAAWWYVSNYKRVYFHYHRVINCVYLIPLVVFYCYISLQSYSPFLILITNKTNKKVISIKHLVSKYKINIYIHSYFNSQYDITK